MKSETDALKDLYTTLIDSRDGYTEAAEAVESAHLQQLFSDLSEKRAEDAQTLRAFLAQEGVELDDDGSILASAHRAFLELKESLTGSDDEAVVAEVIRGEDKLLETYDDAIRPMTADSAAYRFAIEHHARLADRLDELRGVKARAA